MTVRSRGTHPETAGTVWVSESRSLLSPGSRFQVPAKAVTCLRSPWHPTTDLSQKPCWGCRSFLILHFCPLTDNSGTVSHWDIHSKSCFLGKNFLLCRIMNGGRSFFKTEHKEKTQYFQREMDLFWKPVFPKFDLKVDQEIISTWDC